MVSRKAYIRIEMAYRMSVIAERVPIHLMVRERTDIFNEMNFYTHKKETFNR